MLFNTAITDSSMKKRSTPNWNEVALGILQREHQAKTNNTNDTASGSINNIDSGSNSCSSTSNKSKGPFTESYKDKFTAVFKQMDKKKF